MNRDFDPARKEGRGRAVVIIFLILVVGGMLIHGLTGYLEGLKNIAGDNPELAFAKLRRFSSIFLLINAIITFLFAAYLTLIGWRTWKNEQFPPPGVKLIRSTKVHTGSHAKAIAVISVIVALLMMSTNLFLWYFFETIGSFEQKMYKGAVKLFAVNDLNVGFESAQSSFRVQNRWR